jgi:hypothetical protein
MEIDELEAKWEQQFGFNASQLQEETADDNDVTNDGEQPANTSSEHAGASSQVHMELFYN